MKNFKRVSILFLIFAVLFPLVFAVGCNPNTDESGDNGENSEIDEASFTPTGYLRLLTPDYLCNPQLKFEVTVSDNADGDGTAFVTFTATDDKPIIYYAFNKIFQVGRYVNVKYRLKNTGISGAFRIGTDGFDDDGTKDFDYLSDGEWHIAKTDLSACPLYSGSAVNSFRFDPLIAEKLEKGASIDISWIAFYADDGKPLADAMTFEACEKTTDGKGETELVSGATFNASNYTTKNGNAYTVSDNFSLNLVNYYDNFNNYTLKYSSSAPIKGSISYVTHGGETLSEEFFLEEGNDKTFSSLIDGYFDSVYGQKVTSINLSVLRDNSAQFEIHDFSTSWKKVFAAGNYYFENERYRIGVLLSWGGGISYIEDKADGDDTVTNLINRFDAGRLIQQSYYGVSTEEYNTAYSFGSLWSYNPVQGGDAKNNASKIVAFDFATDAEGNTSVYVKCRPKDWAQDNMSTPSYMEDTVTLTPKAIYVNNRFVDFSGFNNPSRHQELPAFYTISYLGNFCYYNGSAPWTDGEYETLPDEGFWSGRDSAYHKIVEGNTETWAAWVNDDGYGIGLFVPDTEIMCAGRFDYDGSKNPKGRATSYVAPLREFAITSYTPFEYGYVIASGTVSEMRSVFKTYFES